MALLYIFQFSNTHAYRNLISLTINMHFLFPPAINNLLVLVSRFIVLFAQCRKTELCICRKKMYEYYIMVLSNFIALLLKNK